jgi:hypothetical protein
MMFMKLSGLFLILLIPLCSSAQFVVSADTQMGTAQEPLITISTGESIVNDSDFDFSTANVNLILNGFSVQEINGRWVLHRLRVDGKNRKNINGSLQITENINFVSGFLHVEDDSKLLFTGSEDGIEITGTAGESYVDGILFQAGKGNRKFPVGSGAFYAPFIFSNVQSDEEIGVSVFPTGASLNVTDDIIETDNSRYWMIQCDDIAAIKSKVQVSLVDNSFTQIGTIVILQSDAVSGDAENAGSSSEGTTLITSDRNITKPVVTLGKIAEVDIKIHNLITPFGSKDRLNNKNLYIHHLGLFESNKVTLLDRWGVVQHAWTNYDNENPNYDFTNLTPGNYIVIVECTDRAGKTIKQSQMVTVLKTN